MGTSWQMGQQSWIDKLFRIVWNWKTNSDLPAESRSLPENSGKERSP